MNRRFLILSILISAIVFFVFVWRFQTAGNESRTASDNGSLIETTGAPNKPPAHAAEPLSVRRYVTNRIPFHYSMIMSDDLKKYITNLRSVKCPEQTVRDIIIAIVDRKYKPMLASLQPKPSRDYWKARFRSTPQPNATSEEQLAKLRKERAELLRSLFGSDPEEQNRVLAEGQDNQIEPLAFLSRDSVQKVAEINKRYAPAHAEIEKKLRQKGHINEEVQRELKAKKNEELAEIEMVLPPEEFRLYELNNSPLASELRWDLTGFNPSEEEFSRIYDLKKSTGTLEGNGAKQTFEAALSSTLGEGRLKDYQRSQDESYRMLWRLLDRYNMPETAAVEVYEAKRTAEDRRRSILTDQSLSTDVKLQHLKGIENETRQRVQALMGDRPFKTYVGWGSHRWMDDLGKLPQ